MKTLPVGLAAHLATRSTTLSTALKITRTDGTIFGFTSHDIDDVVSGVTYSANPGLDVTNIVISANAAVGNLELTTLHDGMVFTTKDIFNGVWKNAAFTIFRYNYASISDGIDTLLGGTLGECQIKLNQVVVELRDLRQYLQQPIGDVSSKTCRYRFGDSRCGVILVGSPNAFIVSGAVTGVTSNQVFVDSSRSEVQAWFDEGEITFVTGNNAGISAKVKSYTVGSPPIPTFTLALPLYGTVVIGDSYTAIKGCRKRLSDCVENGNVLNFGGEPHRQGLNDLTKSIAGDV